MPPAFPSTESRPEIVMQAGSPRQTFPSRPSAYAVVEHAYELAIFQICDDGGLYTELSADQVQQLLLEAITAEVARTGSSDPETLKTAALTAAYGGPASLRDLAANSFSYLLSDEASCPS